MKIENSLLLRGSCDTTLENTSNRCKEIYRRKIINELENNIEDIEERKRKTQAIREIDESLSKFKEKCKNQTMEKFNNCIELAEFSTKKKEKLQVTYFI